MVRMGCGSRRHCVSQMIYHLGWGSVRWLCQCQIFLDIPWGYRGISYAIFCGISEEDESFFLSHTLKSEAVVSRKDMHFFYCLTHMSQSGTTKAITLKTKSFHGLLGDLPIDYVSPMFKFRYD